MSLEIKTVETQKDLRRFVKVPFRIFQGNPYWVPPLIRDEMETFNPKKNPAFEQAEARLFLACKDGEPAGRIAGILSHAANRKYHTRNLRFGWFDCIQDYEVGRKLFREVEDYGKELGMETLTGPHGFTDLDPEGMVVEGFDQLPTIALYYNHPYYPEFTQRYGFEKEIDYVEFRSYVPYETGIPEDLLKIAERLKQRGRLRVLQFKNGREVKERADDVFQLLDEAYAALYGFVPLTEKQVRYYIDKYFPFVDKDLIQMVVNEQNELVGFLISMPSLSKAFQKAKGRLFPFGWFHILRALRHYEAIDFYLVGVKKQYQGRGVDLLMVLELAKSCFKRGIKYGESNVQLETNRKVQALWKPFNPAQIRRRRIYKKRID